MQQDFFESLRREIDAVLDASIPAGVPVALLMYPYDTNVGNHLMWIAIMDYLNSRRTPVAYVCFDRNFRVADLTRAIGTGPIIFLGGVTISRLWSANPAIRRIVARAFPDNCLISLPSTVMFIDEVDRREASDIFGDHRNAMVMARDPVSYANARDCLPDTITVTLSPDLAFRLPCQKRRSKPIKDIIWIVRDDAERGIPDLPPGAEPSDWPSNMRTEMPASYFLLRLSGLFSRARSSQLGKIPVVSQCTNAIMTRLYVAASRHILRYGNALLDEGKVLITDRLHPHVLAALRGQPVVLLPDKFGKNRAVFEAYTSKCSDVLWAETPEEAISLAQYYL